MNGADLFVAILKEWEVPFVATLCGHGMNDIDAACRRAGMPLVDVRNEQAAAYMAETLGRFTGRPGVCAVSSGVAHANALTGVLNARFDGAPMLLVTGCGPTETIGMGHFQDFDQVGMAAPVCKYAEMIRHVDQIPRILHKAYNLSINGRPGPVHISFPTDVQTDSAASVSRSGLAARPERAVSQGDQRLVERAAALIALANRPLLIAGSGIHYADGSPALMEFASEQSIPVVTPIWDRGSTPKSTAEYAGVCGAATGGPDLISQSDLVIVAGAACDYRVGYLSPPTVNTRTPIIRIDADPEQLSQGITPDVAIAGDLAIVLEQLSLACGRLDHPKPEAWRDEAVAQRKSHRQACIDSRPRNSTEAHALDIVAAVEAVLTEDTVIIVDGGNIGQWCHQVLFDRYPGHWMTCGASGVVGYGLPAAMTARLLYPDRPIILISGDGSITFTIAELESAARQNLGFTVLLADDEAWGITLTGHMQTYGEGITSELGTVRFDKVAEGFGAESFRVDDATDIESLLRDSLSATDQPTMIHIPIARSNPADRP